MGRWRLLLAVFVVGLVMLGCKSSPPNLKPDPEPEYFGLPPENDPRYNSPPEYPSDTLYPDPYAKKKRGPFSAPGKGTGMRPSIGGF